MNIRFLETVVWLSELNNFRLTAERMKISPAAISNRIAAVEQELGIRLFERDTREVRLTAEGQEFVTGAREIVSQYKRLVRDVIPEESVEGFVRIGVMPSMALTILPGIIEMLRNKFPRVRVSITTDSSRRILEKLDQRDLDVVLGFHGDNLERYRVNNLCTFGMFWIGGKHSFPHDSGLTKIDLLSKPIISYEFGSQSYLKLEQYMPSGWQDETIVHFSNALSTTVNMISNGIGISVLPPIVVQNELRTGTVRVLDVVPQFPSVDYFSVYMSNPSSPLAPLVASIASDVAREFCMQYDDALALSNA